MTDTLTFYTNPMSRGRIVALDAGGSGPALRDRRARLRHSMKAPDYLAINPMGKVPAIRHGDTVVTEAAAICAYLADAFPQPTWRPDRQSKRAAPYYRWMFFAAGPVEAATTNQGHGLDVPEEKSAWWATAHGARARRARTRVDATRLHRGRKLHRRRCLFRLANRLGPAIRHDRKARGLRSLLARLPTAPPPSARAKSTTPSSPNNKSNSRAEP